MVPEIEGTASDVEVSAGRGNLLGDLFIVLYPAEALPGSGIICQRFGVMLCAAKRIIFAHTKCIGGGGILYRNT